MVDFSGFRIGLVGPLPPPAGGMANQTRQLSELLTAAGASVELVQTNAPYRPSAVAGLRGIRALFRLMPYLYRLWKASRRADLLHVMANSGWSWHLLSVPAIAIGRCMRVPVVINYRGGEADAFLRRSGGLVRFAMRSATSLVVPSGFLQRVFADHGMAALVVPNIIDLNRFAPGAQGASSDHVVVTRNLEAIYGIDTALRAFALVLATRPSARLTIAGTGPEEPVLRALAHTLGLGNAVQFVGRLDRDAVASLYRQARVALNPSRVDNMPNSVLEAMACKVPLVSTNVGGVSYIVQDGRTALLVPADDEKRMAHALLRLLSDEQLHTSLAHAGAQEVLRYTWEQVSPILHSAYCAAQGRMRHTAAQLE